MAAKEVRLSDDARQRNVQGRQHPWNAVKATLGPKGRNAVLEKSYGAPTITKDGVSVAKEIELKDRFENMGAQMLKEVASNTSDEAGDGTTTATVLAQAIIREGLKAVASGRNPMDIKRGIDKAVLVTTDELKRLSKPCKDSKAIAQVGTISANSDESIGKTIADAMEKVGKEGVITVEEAKDLTMNSRWSMACSSTALSFPVFQSTSSRVRRPSSKSVDSSCAIRRSRISARCSRSWRRSRRRAVR